MRPTVSTLASARATSPTIAAVEDADDAVRQRENLVELLRNKQHRRRPGRESGDQRVDEGGAGDVDPARRLGRDEQSRLARTARGRSPTRCWLPPDRLRAGSSSAP